jgi:DNA integrity scanning protein DisA with diadenylate cyclase activity
MLTDKEKQGLITVLDLFSVLDKVKTIKRVEGRYNSYLSIELIDETCQLFSFPTDTLFTGMEDDEEYTLLQLGIIERSIK